MFRRDRPEEAESRTFPLSPDDIEVLCSLDRPEVYDVIDQLPIGLSGAEINDIITQIANSLTTLNYFRGKRLLGVDTAMFIGIRALHKRGDLTTAENAAKVLRLKGVSGFLGSISLRWDIRSAKKKDLRRQFEN